MNNHQQSAVEKLREGQQILSSAGNDHYRLGAALLMIHGAWEDRLRDLLARRLPARSSEILDNHVTNWKELLALAEDELGLVKADRSFIAQANAFRNTYAHDVQFEWSRDGLVQYEQLIRQLWNTGSRTTSSAYRPAASTPPPQQPRASSSSTYSPRGASAPARSTAAAATYPAASRAPAYHNLVRPWYRSTGCLWLSFFLLPPVWAMLILTDRNQSGGAKVFAALVLMTSLLIGFFACVLLGYLPWTQDLGLDLPSLAIDIPSLGLEIPVIGLATEAAPLLADTTPSTNRTEQNVVPSNTEEGCRVVWAEYAGNLRGMNRSMVWNDVVTDAVKSTGLEWKEFSRLVVEKNPGLVGDGYEFLAGKTYRLPVCE